MKEVVADVCPNLRLEDQPDIVLETSFLDVFLTACVESRSHETRLRRN